MEASSRPLMRIFDSTVCYQILLFQRPYVRRSEINWQLLWSDFERLLGLALGGEKLRPHLLSAVEMELLRSVSGAAQIRQVNDGQQRFTSLQLSPLRVSAGSGPSL